MSGLRQQITRRLRSEESVTAVAELDPDAVVITDQRAIVYCPSADGSNFYTIELLNIESATIETDAETERFENIIKLGGGGAAAAFVGMQFDFASFLPTDVSTSGTGQVGVGGILALIDVVRLGLVQFQNLLVIGGAIAVLLGLASSGRYLQSRQRVLIIDVAGDESIMLPVGDEHADACERLVEQLKLNADWRSDN